MSQLSIIGGIGGLFGATFGGSVYEGGRGFSEGKLFIIAAVVMIISGIIVQFTILSNQGSKITKELYPTSISSKQNKEKKLSSLDEVPGHIKKIFFIFLISLVFINFGRNSVVLISSFFLVDRNAFSASDSDIALFRNTSSVATMITGFLLGSILSKIKDTIVLMIGSIFALLSVIWLSLAPTFSLVLISAALIGSAMVIIQASSYSIVAKIIPEDFRGRFFAYYNATFFLSWGIGGTLITGPIADYLISHGMLEALAYRFSFLVAALLVIVGIIILFIVIPKVNSLANDPTSDL